MSLLIDADYIVYKACASAECELDFGDDVIVVTSQFSEAMKLVNRELFSIAECMGVFDDMILFFSGPNNFRKMVDPEYKGNRNRRKPCGYKRVVNLLRKEYPVVMYDNLEADDALGIWSTREPLEHIIVSPDKDMRQIPGLLFNLKDATEEIEPEEADRWHYIQTLAGDCTDGYSGVPGIGIKRADALLTKEGMNWTTVVNAYAAKDLDEKVAIQNATLARILRHENYDIETGQITFWQPPTDAGAGADDGAAVQHSTD